MNIRADKTRAVSRHESDCYNNYYKMLRLKAAKELLLYSLYSKRLGFRQGVKLMSNWSLYIINEDCE